MKANRGIVMTEWPCGLFTNQIEKLRNRKLHSVT